MSLCNDLLRFSYEHQRSHIPSALSMLNYLSVIFNENIVTRDWNIIIGKPFGSQAYYIIWDQLGWLDRPELLSIGVKHDEIEFVDYGEETMGNALGVASGIRLANGKPTWVNLSDATLQMGNTLEAIQFIGANQVPMLVTVDFNGTQVTGHTDDIIPILPVYEMARQYGWSVDIVDGNDYNKVSTTLQKVDDNKPTMIFMKTKKGAGVADMENDPFGWHYRTLEDESYFT